LIIFSGLLAKDLKFGHLAGTDPHGLWLTSESKCSRDYGMTIMWQYLHIIY
jgi:hypothetical protein